MNRFRTKKKARDDPSGPRPSIESDSTKPFRMFTKRQKSRDEEIEKPLDLATALPSNDEFRTSLLMTGLSARFSMLREQDDPTSKIGKASDDSVLFRRQSRMDFGGPGGLQDIAEVESIKAYPSQHFDSFRSSDDGASISGSIMNRGKPTEGNNLFGGRQKIYKITGSNSSKLGSLPGRALYDDDVSVSAFQRWRQAEKEKAAEEEDEIHDHLESDLSVDLKSRRRETSSTTSSGPSAARSSTAATSVASQMAASLKDPAGSTATPTLTSGTPTSEHRSNVTRTRRLYEQGLTQDLHDHQSIAQSRLDGLSRQRTAGSRTPDLISSGSLSNNPSLAERASDRRPIISKASAPNLRSFSPPILGRSQTSPADSLNKSPPLDHKPAYGANPPLSPPTSESGEHPTLSIRPNDRGKATAMGVFSRPAQQYDEFKYALRQRQLQQGRDTPVNRVRSESNVSAPTSRSRSSSSMSRAAYEKQETAQIKAEPTVKEEAPTTTFFNEDDDDSASDDFEAPTIPQLALARPDDQDHPAYRKSALPTPLTLSAGNSNAASPTSERNEVLTVHSKKTSQDSPTLGDGTGLSGMVRQHLRNESTTSSVYGPVPSEFDHEVHEPLATVEASPSLGDAGIESAGWKISLDNTSPPRSAAPSAPSRNAPHPSPGLPSSSSDQGIIDQENEAFARHLADGARRVREKLGSYVDADNGIQSSSELAQEAPRSRPGAFDRLRPKSSRGSLGNKSSQRDRSQSRPGRVPNVESSGPSIPLPSVFPDTREETSSKTRIPGGESQASPSDTDKEENVHAGLKAFRQARRELQKMREADVQHRYQGPPRDVPTNDQAGPSGQYSRNAGDESKVGDADMRSPSQETSERDRSGSEASLSGRPRGVSSRLRNGAAGYDQSPGFNAHGSGPIGPPRHSPMMRQPLNPGVDMRRSPMMPSSGMPSPALSSPGMSPGAYGRSASAQGLALQTHHGAYDPDHGSAMSSPKLMTPPWNGPESPHRGALGAAASTPNLRNGASAPPLPPINPLRKTGRPGQQRHSDDEQRGSQQPSMSPIKSRGAREAPVSPDDDVGPEAYRQRRRMISSDVNGVHGRVRGMRTSPPHPPSRPAPAPGHMMSEMQGGMI